MIRPATPEDTSTLVALTDATGVFKSHEIVALESVLEDYYDFNEEEDDHVCVVFEEHGTILGYAYYAPAAMTDRTWYLYWIAVTKDKQARGVGTKLLHHTEEDIKKKGGRVLFIETSGLPHYEKTRKFYIKHKYEEAAVLRDYYSDGDDMVVYRKHFGE
jgi:ribosomal protein S18 acetylase RimI-like enzyme